MNNQNMSRVNQMKQYISSLRDSVLANDHHNALLMMSKFKKSIVRDDPNQFLLDCLKSKYEQLSSQLVQLQKQKAKLEEGNIKKININRKLKEIRASIFISRLSVTLNEVKKVQYDQVILSSDYLNVVINSFIGTKYQEYNVEIMNITSIDHKGVYLLIQYSAKNLMNILIKFVTQKDALKWSICLKIAVNIQTWKKKDNLFQKKMEVNNSKQQFKKTNSNQNIHYSQASPVSSTITMQHIPFLSFNNNNGMKNVEFAQSVISQKRQISGQKSNDRSMQKNTQKSLVNALNIENYNSNHLNFKKQNLSQYKYQTARPPNLTRIRGRSQNNDLQIKNMTKSSNLRKQSEDIIWKHHINKSYHDKMLQKYTHQQKLNDQNGSNMTFKSQKPSKSQKNFETKPKSLQKFKEQQTDLEYKTKINKNQQKFSKWKQIKQIDDQNRSKSSNNNNKSNTSHQTSRRPSYVSQTHIISRNQITTKTELDQNRSQKITQKSQQQSPTPKYKNSQKDFPTKVSYKDGTILRLFPVQKNQQIKQSNNSHNPHQKKINNSQVQIKADFQSSQSQSLGHESQEQHQNNSSSQDNNQRAQQLKKGIILIKCSQNGFWTHEKSVYLSQNQLQLCSRDVKDKKLKKIKISDIKSVQYKKFDKGIIKHYAKKIQQNKCLVIRALAEDSKIKNYQFVSNNPIALQHFSKNLNQFIQYIKQR